MHQAGRCPGEREHLGAQKTKKWSGSREGAEKLGLTASPQASFPFTGVEKYLPVFPCNQQLKRRLHPAQ